MANNKADPTVTEETPSVKETKYTIEELRKHSVALFGVTPSTFDGATYGLKGPISKADMKAHIDKWLEKVPITQREVNN